MEIKCALCGIDLSDKTERQKNERECNPCYFGRIKSANSFWRWYSSTPEIYREADFKKDFKIPVELLKSLYVWGPVGTGKTRFVYGLLREIFYEVEKTDDYSTVVFCHFEELMRQLRDSMDTGEKEETILARYTKADVLVLDDLGGVRTSKISDYSLSAIFEIIDSRYVHNKQTIITSNKPLAQLAEDFDQRIASRIKEMCRVINLVGEDRRLKKGNS